MLVEIFFKQYINHMMYSDDQEYSGEQPPIRKKLKTLNYQQQRHRKFLASSYRKLHQLSSKQQQFFVSKDKIIDLVTNYAFQLRKFDINLCHNLTMQTMITLENYAINRRCLTPKIVIDNEEIIDQNNTGQNEIYRDKEFLISVEGEPNSRIFYTTDGSHPLLSPTRNCSISETLITTMNPPCIIKLLAVKDLIKIQSHMVVIQVNVTNVKNGGRNPSIRNGMIRPQINFPFDESNSIASQSYVGIEKDPPSNKTRN